MKRKQKVFVHKDPVCGMEVSHRSAIDLLTYAGKNYYFCSTGCREAFEAEPQKYLWHGHQHGKKPG
ncbi:MAG: YHS domain-containing protein [Wenzhouxiangellaceae bacterium]|nr:YHS domain-containing protein [Wenzhouxiangellaceae bacterium]